MTTSSQLPVFFCHGVPGCPQDGSLLDAQGRTLVAPNLFAVSGKEPLTALLEMFDTEIADGGHEGFHVVGFSIGAMAALRLAAARPEKIAKVTVVSPAVPLSLGDFLPDTAGAPVFKLAMKRPAVLRLLTALQGLLARKAPGVLINQLFAKCGTQERALLQDTSFVECLKAGMRNGFGQHRDGYLAYLAAYVDDWSAELAQVQAPVEIWQGDKDTWAPIAMAEALNEVLSAPCALHVVPEGEHYSTLQAVRLQ